MSTTTQYVPRDFRRVCDQCGVLWNRSQLHHKGPWRYCNDCDQPGDRIREQEDAAIARTRPFRILPVPNAKRQSVHSPYDWTLEDAQIFNLIASAAPADRVGQSSNTASAAWAAVYLADMINQGIRPPAWLASGKTILRTCLTYLLTQQYGSPTGISPAGSVQNPRYGGISDGSGTYSTATTIAAGAAFVKAATALADSTLLGAADRCATFLRHVQCGDLQVSAWTVFPSGGGPYHVGGLSSGVVDATGLLSGNYNLADVLGLWFLKLLVAVRSPSTSYGDGAATAFFSASTAAPLSQMMAEMGAFASLGAYDSSAGSSLVTGLSSTKPQAIYSAALNGGGGTASWTASATVPGVSLAMAMLGVFQAFGATAQITSMLAWLAAVGANAANATPSTNTPQQTLNGITGTYSAATAPATSYTSAAPFTEATGALYDLAALGFLAPILNSTNVAALKNARSTVSPIEPYSVIQPDGRFPGPLGRAGLSLQPNSASGQSIPSVLLAAQFGNSYRYAVPS